MNLFIRLLFCVSILSLFLYCYIDKQNQITQLRLQIPAVTKELRVVEQENTHLQYKVDQFEDPLHLMELARQPQFSHLKHPMNNEILIIPVPSSEEL